MIALIDMDLVVFRSAISAEKDELSIAIHRAHTLLDNLIKKTEATEYRAFLSHPSNFRKDILPTYKANRTAPKPKHLAKLREYAVENMGAEISREGLEADDELAIHQTDETIIVTLDKDLLQVAGQHFSWEIKGKKWKRPDKFFFQTELEGLRLFYEQCIKGDNADNVIGIKGLGDKKAKQMLANCQTELEMFRIVQPLYADDEKFIKNAICLHMKRTLEDNWRDKFEQLQKQAGSKGLEDTQEEFSIS